MGKWLLRSTSFTGMQDARVWGSESFPLRFQKKCDLQQEAPEWAVYETLRLKTKLQWRPHGGRDTRNIEYFLWKAAVC